MQVRNIIHYTPKRPLFLLQVQGVLNAIQLRLLAAGVGGIFPAGLLCGLCRLSVGMLAFV